MPVCESCSPVCQIVLAGLQSDSSTLRLTISKALSQKYRVIRCWMLRLVLLLTLTVMLCLFSLDVAEMMQFSFFPSFNQACIHSFIHSSLPSFLRS